MAEFHYQPLFEKFEDHTRYRKITSDHVSAIEFEDRIVLKVEPEALELLAAEAIRDVSHLLRSSHLAQLAKILDIWGLEPPNLLINLIGGHMHPKRLVIAQSLAQPE